MTYGLVQVWVSRRGRIEENHCWEPNAEGNMIENTGKSLCPLRNQTKV